MAVPSHAQRRRRVKVEEPLIPPVGAPRRGPAPAVPGPRRAAGPRAAAPREVAAELLLQLGEEHVEGLVVAAQEEHALGLDDRPQEVGAHADAGHRAAAAAAGAQGAAGGEGDEWSGTLSCF